MHWVGEGEPGAMRVQKSQGMSVWGACVPSAWRPKKESAGHVCISVQGS